MVLATKERLPVILPAATSVKAVGWVVMVIAGITGVKSGSYTEVNQPVIVVDATPLSPSVTSAFQGCLLSPSSLFRLNTVPSIVGLEKVIESPFVASW